MLIVLLLSCAQSVAAPSASGKSHGPPTCPRLDQAASTRFESASSADPFEVQFFPQDAGIHGALFVGELTNAPDTAHVGTVEFWWATNNDPEWHYGHSMDVTYNWVAKSELKAGGRDDRFKFVFVPDAEASFAWYFCKDWLL